MMPRACLILLMAVAPAWGQFSLYLVNGAIEQPVPRTYDVGPVEPGSSLAVPFRIRNVSNSAATLDLLTVNGAGFSLVSANKPVIPQTLAAQQAVDFTVLFQSSGTGNYSAALDSVGIDAILTASVPVELTCQLVTATGVQPLAAAPVDFGTVTQGTTATRHIVLLNQTAATLLAPGPLVSGAGFSLSGTSPGGTLVQPASSVTFDIAFTPTAAGAATGTLTIGDRSYRLIGTGALPPLPQPRISISLAQSASAQQGAITVNLDAAAQIAGTGTVTLSFSGADPAIAFASGGQSASFTVAAGDTQAHFGASLSMPFQTGTTAGTITLTAQLGSNIDRQTVAILPAVVGVTAAQVVRSSVAVEVDLTGYDNTRTAGSLIFTFYDASGSAIAPAIQADGSGAFASYFQNAAGGTFTLKAVFPVLGDTSQIKSVQAVVANSAGSATTARISF